MSSSSTMQLSTYVLKAKVFKRTWGVILIARLPKSRHVPLWPLMHWYFCLFPFTFIPLPAPYPQKQDEQTASAKKCRQTPSANSGIYLTENKVFSLWQPQVERRRRGKWGNVDGKWWNRGASGQVPEDRQILSASRCAGDSGDSGGQLRLRRNPWNRCACGRTLPFFSSAWRIGDQSDLDDTGVVTVHGDTLSL